MSGLIEGLPDAVAIRCLARVPFYLYPKLELVSRSWRAAIHSLELFKARQEVGSSEDLLCVCAFDPENLWQLYDPLRDLWITLPVLPTKIRHLSRFGAVATAGKLFVIGGGSDAVDPLTGDQDGSFATNEVWSYDPVVRQWAQRASMLVPRSMFACCVLNGKIIVAGGFTSYRKSVSQAELYDPEKDVWIQMPNLHCAHNSACLGVVIGGKVHVLHKGLSTVQVLDNGVGGAPGWTVQESGWLQGPMAVVGGALYVMSHGFIIKQDKGERKIMGLASEFQRRIGFGMIGVGDDLYVIGGVVGPDGLNWDINPLADVDILTPLGSDRTTWRQASPMSRCHEKRVSAVAISNHGSYACFADKFGVVWVVHLAGYDGDQPLVDKKALLDTCEVAVKAGFTESNEAEEHAYAVTDLCTIMHGSLVAVALQSLQGIILLRCSLSARTLSVSKVISIAGEAFIPTSLGSSSCAGILWMVMGVSSLPGSSYPALARVISGFDAEQDPAGVEDDKIPGGEKLLETLRGSASVDENAFWQLLKPSRQQ